VSLLPPAEGRSVRDPVFLRIFTQLHAQSIA
jgi:hypothetical protein